MFDWLMFLSQLALWAVVAHLYRTRNRPAAPDSALAAPAIQPAVPADFDWESITFAPGAFVAAPPAPSDEFAGVTAQLKSLADRLDGTSAERAAGVRRLLDEIEGRAARLAKTLEENELLLTPSLSAAAGPALRAYTSEDPRPEPHSAAEDLPAIARHTGRQREEVALLRHLAQRAEGRKS